MANGEQAKEGVINLTDKYFLKTEDLCVGYDNKPLISDINIGIEKGEILTLIGPNGSGKSTILKSITKHLSMISGVVYIDKKNLNEMSNKETATKISVVLTEKIKPEMMNCYDVVASGRYPYTNYFGKLTKHDHEVIYDSLEKVHAVDLAEREFSAISDGQRQRIMLARAICQEPEIIILDEPTSFLDIRHKIELLEILRKMSREKNITVVMSLHEIDLAPKISDKVMCVKGDTISRFGTPGEIFKEEIINELYSISEGSYNMIFGSVELKKTLGESEAFVIAGAGCGTPIYRELQKLGIAFDTGILYENDVDYQVAKALSGKVYSSSAFNPVSDELIEEVKRQICGYKAVIDSGVCIGKFNEYNEQIIKTAEENQIPVYKNLQKAVSLLNGK